MFLQCMAKKGASILGSPGEEDGQGNVGTSLTSPSKISSEKQVWTFPLTSLRRFLFLLFMPLSHCFSSRSGEGKDIKRSIEVGGEHYLRVEKIRD